MTIFDRILQLKLDFQDEGVKQIRVDRVRLAVSHGHNLFGLVKVLLGVDEVVQVAERKFSVVGNLFYKKVLGN